MRVLIFGAGALGSLFGGLLAEKNEVHLLGRGEHMAAVRQHGLMLEGEISKRAMIKTLDRLDAGDTYDLAILTTKSYDTQDAMDAMKTLWEDCIFLSFQNGLENEDWIAESARYVVGGVTSHGAYIPSPGTVIHAGVGETWIGPWKGVSTARVAELAVGLSASGIQTSVSEQIRIEKWRKAIVNAAINPLTALLRCKNGELLEIPQALSIMEQVIRECVEIARSHEYFFRQEDILEMTRNVCTLTRENRSSMLQDVLKGRRTEVHEINGSFVRKGKERKVRTPVNETLVDAIAASERGNFSADPIKEGILRHLESQIAARTQVA